MIRKVVFLLFFPFVINAQNLIPNGDFELGNQDFISDYDLNCLDISEGEYCVSVPTDWTLANPNWKPVPTITFDGIGGKILHVNGDSILNKKVWSSTVTNLNPNTAYRFSFYMSTITNLNLAKVQVLINGDIVGIIKIPSSVAGDWNWYFETFNTGNSTEAEISIINVNNSDFGNDFALDQLQLEEVEVIFPNVFTPFNRSSSNKYFEPIGEFGNQKYTLKIYNRWGLLVHESNQDDNVLPKWNGKMLSSNKECSAGTYFWILTTTFNALNGKEVDNNTQGYIQLLN